MQQVSTQGLSRIQGSLCLACRCCLKVASSCKQNTSVCMLSYLPFRNRSNCSIPRGQKTNNSKQTACKEYKHKCAFLPMCESPMRAVSMWGLCVVVLSSPCVRARCGLYPCENGCCGYDLSSLREVSPCSCRITV